jgi:hypothetical protein
MATSIPKTMKGVIVEKTGGVEVLEYKTDLPVPSPKEGEVLVKNDFIGINYIDTCVSFPPPTSLPIHLRSARIPGTPRYYLCHERDTIFETNVVFETSNTFPS